MENSIEAYLKAQEYSWSESTKKSETSRLRSLVPLFNLTPIKLWAKLCETHKPYTRSTMWTRLCSYYDWCLEQGIRTQPNPYRDFKKQNRRSFKNVYERKPSEFAYQDVKKRVSRIKCEDARYAANQLLVSGMRSFELSRYKDGEVRGKGNKIRKIFGVDRQYTERRVTYNRLYTALKGVGLKPHDLRKAFLTELVKQGANHFELCEIAGWSNINTASSYISVDKRRLEKLVLGVKE